MIAAQADFGEGVPLRTRTTTINRQVNKKGEVKKAQESVIDTKVTEWKETDTSGIDFDVPSGYTETPMVVPGAGGEEGEGNPLKDLFKRNG